MEGTLNPTIREHLWQGGSQVLGGAAHSLHPPGAQLVPWSRSDQLAIVSSLVSDEERRADAKPTCCLPLPRGGEPWVASVLKGPRREADSPETLKTLAGSEEFSLKHLAERKTCPLALLGPG